MYRTGKSYLLNKMLLETNKGFEVGPTINPCTKGLWIWGRPLKIKNKHNEEINVLIIDTEGLGALDVDANHDNKIFSLALLLSNVFIYNSMGTIDEYSIENLNLIVNLTKHVHLKTSENDGIDEQFIKDNFPVFYWVIRDFTLKLVNENNDKITENEYLEKALQDLEGYTDEIMQKNHIRKLLKT